MGVQFSEMNASVDFIKYEYCVGVPSTVRVLYEYCTTVVILQ